MQVWERKLKYFQRINSPSFTGSSYIKICLEYHKLLDDESPYINELNSICTAIGSNLSTDSNFGPLLDSWGQEQVLLKVDSKPSLQCCPIPAVWWKRRPYITDSVQSKILNMFRAGSTDAGESDNHYQNSDFSTYRGRIPVCPGCSQSRNTCSHYIVSCPTTAHLRDTTPIGGVSLSTIFSSAGSPSEKLKMFLDISKDKPEVVNEKSKALLSIRDYFVKSFLR